MSADSTYIAQAKMMISAVRGKPLSISDRGDQAIALAALLIQEAQRIQTHSEKKMQAQLARMMQDPIGKVFTSSMTDQCFRSSNPVRVADQLIYLLKKLGVPSFLPFIKRLQLNGFRLLGNAFPALLVPLAKEMLRSETATVILPGESNQLIQHLQKRYAEGVRVNLNHLGEAILGEAEAEKRLAVYLGDLAKPEVEYISVKISTICSQINLLAWEETLAIILTRLRQLLRAAIRNEFLSANGKLIPKFVNLDMEEYRDLNLTVEAFRRILDEPEFFHHSAGIVLQSYLPDSYVIQQELTSWARKRLAEGGAPIKIRIVKGANLAMEMVEASLRGWPQAPYTEKNDTDANFKRMVQFGCEPQNASAVHLGVASHNLFDIAYALLLRAENCIEQNVCFEMLEGMADHMRRAVQTVAEDILLYCPAATHEEFLYAIAYLIRRLDENTAPHNFLHDLFGLHPESIAWKNQAALFSHSLSTQHTVSNEPRKTQNRLLEPVRPPFSGPFTNEPDTDWSLLHNRRWGEQILHKWSSCPYNSIPLVLADENIFTESNMGIGEDPAQPGHTLYRYSLAEKAHLEKALQAAQKAAPKWALSSFEERSLLLNNIAHELRRHRADLIGAMVADTGKTIYEADVEVSEAIDFAEYYRRNACEWADLEGIQWRPKGTVLVAPPWNFPCSIPAGGILSALMAGNCVLFKPAAEAVLVGWQLVQIFWAAGVDRNVLQFLTCSDDPIGNVLVQDQRISAVILTGSTDTAKHLLRIRPGLDLMAETGGKNAMIITSLADRDLAVKDILQSAFGHSGQKCSACSLVICEAEVYDDPNFREQLRDAAVSLPVGSQWNLGTRINPLIHFPNPTLLRGLTSLEEGEEWLLEPKQNEKNPNLWSPGIKLGVKADSFTYCNELFGPVLGIMRADNLSHALQLANGTPYGLTAGLHSLDEREHQYWVDHIEAGNCYINRGITGAIVQRQPFGGCKESSFGPGMKAGGPNYIMQLMHAEEHTLPAQKEEFWHPLMQAMTKLVEKYSPDDLIAWEASIGSYAYFWNHYFSVDHDPSCLLGQDNVLHYQPQQQILLRILPRDSLLDILRVIAAALICGTSLEISSENPIGFLHEGLPQVLIIIEDELALIERLKHGLIKRVRLLSLPSPILQAAMGQASCNILREPVCANGRIELLRYLREVSFSIDYHRYGNLGAREGETHAPY